MSSAEIQADYNELLTMSLGPRRPFPDNPDLINRMLSLLGKNQEMVAHETGKSKQLVSAFIQGTRHNPDIALWFEKHGIYLDREYINPLLDTRRVADRLSA